MRVKTSRNKICGGFTLPRRKRKGECEMKKNKNKGYKKTAGCLCLHTVVVMACCLICCAALTGCAGKAPLYLKAEAQTRGEAGTADGNVSAETGDGSVSAEGGASGKDAAPGEAGSAPGKSGAADGADTCFVYICGAVKHPGVYEVPAGSRVYEVVDRAGGLTADAAPNTVNQAQPVSDGEMIEVLTKQAQKEETVEAQAQADGKIDLNTATVAQLMTLNGIGEAKAAAIVEYREANGWFRSVEDIKNVSGIGDGVFENIREDITVGS